MLTSEIVARLDRAKPAGEGRWSARCPAHEDGTSSLQVTRGTGGRTLIVCFAGCKLDDIVQSMGIGLSDLFEGDDRKTAIETLPESKWPVTATYTYQNAIGEPLYRVLRRTSQDSGRKTFRQEKRNGSVWQPGMEGVDRVLYRLPQILDPETGDDVIWVTEGEKDADALSAMGLVATTNVGGAGKWEPQYTAALKGRHVVILPDNDKPGEEHAAVVSKALTGVAASVRILRLPGLPNKGDVSDWLGEGGTVEQLRAMSDRVGWGDCFLSSPKRLDGERAERLELARHTLSFGVRYLDDAFTGINRRDLVLVGAKTGVGKSQIVTNIAVANCLAGKRVHIFALEAEDREIERRIKYQFVARAYHDEGRFSHRPIRFADWYAGKLDGLLARHEAKADADTAKLLKNLNTYYRIASFTSDDFSRMLDSIHDETDLVVLDHFHYVDSDDENENRGHKRIVKQIRDSALSADRPVIVVGHIRKSDPRNAPLIPTEEAFHGSSDIVKIATKAVMLAPDYETPQQHRSVWPTYIQVVKCRQDSSLTRYAARCSFDTRVNSYEDEYLLGRLTDGGKTFEAVPPASVPDWATGATNGPKPMLEAVP